MTTFADFLKDIEEMVKKHTDAGLALKLKSDQENNIIQVYGGDATPLVRAQNSINEVVEFAHAVAEHHPFWGLLENSAEIATTVIEEWNDKISESEIDEMKWHAKELVQYLERFSLHYCVLKTLIN